MTGSSTRTCAYPGCSEELPESGPHGGPPPQFCDREDHNAHSLYQALKRGEGEVAPDVAARIGLQGVTRA